MSTSRLSNDSGTLSRRRFWQLHRASVMTGLCAGVVMLLTNAAPRATRVVSLYRYGDVYGWPREFLNRDTSGSWLCLPKGRVLEFQGKQLWFDVVVAVAIVVAAGAIVEYRFRIGRKKLFQFTLNELHVAGLAVAAGLGLIVYQYRWQDAALGRLRCNFEVEHGLPDRIRSALPFLPGGRLKPLDRVTTLHIMGAVRPDAYFEPLIQFRRVEQLAIEADFTDGALVYVARMTDLAYLKLESQSLTGEGLRLLTALPRLRSLRLSAPNLSDEGIRQLSRLKNVGLELEMRDVTVTAARLEQLGQITVPWGLTLVDVRLDDNALAALGRLRHVKRLALDASALNDASLVHFERLGELDSLRLIGARQISLEAIERLREKLPHCQVTSY